MKKADEKNGELWTCKAKFKKKNIQKMSKKNKQFQKMKQTKHRI